MKGNRDISPIDLGKVDDSIPITFIVGTEDTLCTPEFADRIYKEFTNANKHITYLPWDHKEFAKNGSQEFTDQICEIIEKDQEKSKVWDSSEL